MKRPAMNPLPVTSPAKPEKWNGQNKELPEDRFAFEFLRVAGLLPEPNAGYFVDIGAADGKTLSNTYVFAELGWRGMMVEPSPYLFPALLKNTAGFEDRVLCVNAALMAADAPGVINWYDSGGDLVSTADESHRALWGKDVKYRFFVVPFVTWREILGVFVGHAAPTRPITFLSIDVEGCNAEVFVALDLAALEPALICVETEPSKPGNRETIMLHAEKYGYTLARAIDCNLFFAKPRDVENFARFMEPGLLDPPVPFDGGQQ